MATTGHVCARCGRAFERTDKTMDVMSLSAGIHHNLDPEFQGDRPHVTKLMLCDECQVKFALVVNTFLKDKE